MDAVLGVGPRVLVVRVPTVSGGSRGTGQCVIVNDPHTLHTEAATETRGFCGTTQVKQGVHPVVLVDPVHVLNVLHLDTQV